MCNKHPELEYERRCPACNREYQRKYMKLNREVQRARIRKNNDAYIARNQEFVAKYLESHPCEVCGETDPVVLEFDHRVREDKFRTISALIRRASSLDLLIKEMDKCRVLCANCHARHTSVQMGYWKSKQAGVSPRSYKALEG